MTRCEYYDEHDIRCPAPGSVKLDGDWYCSDHADAVLEEEG